MITARLMAEAANATVVQAALRAVTNREGTSTPRPVAWERRAGLTALEKNSPATAIPPELGIRSLGARSAT